MAEEIIIQGKTFEAAMEEAQTKYSGENVQYEILEMPKKGIFGIGATPAKIKVIINDANDEEDADLSGIVASIKGLGVTTNKGGANDEEKNAKKSFDKGADKAKSADAKKEKPAKAADEAAPAPAAEAAPVQEKVSAANVAETAAQKPAEKPQREPRHRNSFPKEPRVIEVTEEEKECALKFANTLLSNMGINATARFTGSEPSGIGGNTYPHMEIEGEGAGILIGHHGETLDAIQYLVNLCAHRKGGSSTKEFVKIIVDIEDYRRKREETLRALARRTAAKAVKYKRNMVLEPMNPFERRIIHSEIQDIENVSTHSVGSDENRKIIVCYEGEDKIDRRRGRGYNNRRPAPASLSENASAQAETAAAETAENASASDGEVNE